jgi:hypothetical protein
LCKTGRASQFKLRRALGHGRQAWGYAPPWLSRECHIPNWLIRHIFSPTHTATTLLYLGVCREGLTLLSLLSFLFLPAPELHINQVASHPPIFLMSGLEEIAAVIGFAEVGFRSICFRHEFFRELEDVLRKLKQSGGRRPPLHQCLPELRFLQYADEETHVAIS